jgi:hypothetical protein
VGCLQRQILSGDLFGFLRTDRPAPPAVRWLRERVVPGLRRRADLFRVEDAEESESRRAREMSSPTMSATETQSRTTVGGRLHQAICRCDPCIARQRRPRSRARA